MDIIAEKRKRVGELDAELVRLLAARLTLTDEIGAEKRKRGMPAYAPATEAEVVRHAREVASELGISQSLAEAVIRAAMSEARLRQDRAGVAQAETFGRGNVAASRYLPPPMDFKGAVPLTTGAEETVSEARQSIRDILEGRDERAVLVIGPCSIHDPALALEYAGLLRALQGKVAERFLLVMRCYVEKPRSGTGWTGFLADPRLDGSGDVQEGITLTRKLLNSLGELGVPAAAEFVNPITAAYIGDLVSWASVGARSSASQLHRDMASGLDIPVGFKNGPDGDVGVAVGAVESAARAHDYIGLEDTGAVSAFKTAGNTHCHVVLRGGMKPNYKAKDIGAAQEALRAAGLGPRVMVDCSHGNSGKVAANQPKSFMDVIGQIAKGNDGIIGLMLESSLEPGRQELVPGKLKPGVSVTDECLGWEETESLVLEARDSLDK